MEQGVHQQMYRAHQSRKEYLERKLLYCDGEMSLLQGAIGTAYSPNIPPLFQKPPMQRACPNVRIQICPRLKAHKA